MKVSVIIPTYNRPEQLARALDALNAQTLPSNDFEVVVVDDGSDRPLALLAERQDAFFLQTIQQRNSGATLARNHGASKSHGDYLVFMDDDICLKPDALKRLIAELIKHENSIVMGALIVPPELQTSPFAKLQAGHPVGKRVEEVHWSQTMTGLLAVRASDFNRIKQFRDPTGGWPNWDDIDFGYRADAMGYKLYRCHDAVAEHWDYSLADVEVMGKRYYRASRSAVRLFQLYPRMIDEMRMFDDKRPINWRSDQFSLIMKKLIRPMLSARPVMKLLKRLIHFFEHRLPRPLLLQPLYRWLIGAYIYQGWRVGLLRG